MTNEIMDRRNDIRDWMNADPWMNGFSSIFGDNFPTNDTLKTDIKESDTDYAVRVDMPDFDKKNIDISYSNNTLTVSGHRDNFADHNDNKGDVIMSERSTGRFARQYHLPAVDENNIEANYNNGVLDIKLPKMTETKDNSHHIEIN
ncbi:Hsp20/alpha crystallin family protein [Companilactobacillus ginsenosidimutans]|uniref:Heat-shock protein Hsp20 n=1 Tax=Companilactobacillus ginsenosidimutans TaxID=1007676 RepID=A0A0H4QLK2_9LACO|nr:Hsp20/alpha crystallin family protein [Companilactobacillus ginsenosidimutans]AKP67961.1 heat-shock protein Hsp20 [Companilactobacillus ginsenosidimutans]